MKLFRILAFLLCSCILPLNTFGQINDKALTVNPTTGAMVNPPASLVIAGNNLLTSSNISSYNFVTTTQNNTYGSTSTNIFLGGFELGGTTNEVVLGTGTNLPISSLPFVSTTGNYVATFDTRTGTVTLTPSDLSTANSFGSGISSAIALPFNGTGSIAGSTNTALTTPTLTLPQATTYSTDYLVSMFVTSDTTGPKTFTSVDTSTFYPYYKGTGGADIFTTSAFKDPRIIKIGNIFYLSYTAGLYSSGYIYSIGLAWSYDLVNWTSISTPNWSGYFNGGSPPQTQVWNGCWYFDGTNYWMYFAVGSLSGTIPSVTTTPYIVQFTPAGSSSTFGTPTAITFSPTRSYANIMAVNKISSTYYGLVQDYGTTTGSSKYVETFHTSSLTGTYTIQAANNADGFGTAVERGAEIQLPNGSWKAYFCDFGGGNMYSSTNTTLTTNTWSTPVALTPLPVQVQYPTQSIDWIDIVPFNDDQLEKNLSVLQRGNPYTTVIPWYPGVVVSSTNGTLSPNFVTMATGTNTYLFPETSPVNTVVYLCDGGALWSSSNYVTVGTSTDTLYGLGIPTGTNGPYITNSPTAIGAGIPCFRKIGTNQWGSQ